MEALKEIKQALKTWEHQFSKENGRRPNREDIGLASDKVQSCYSRYNKLKAQLGAPPTPNSKTKSEAPLTPNSKDKPEGGDVWGQSLNRSLEPPTPNSQTKPEAPPTPNSKAKQEAPPTPNSKIEPEGGDVWGQSLNRSFDQRKDNKTLLAETTAETDKEEQATKADFMGKLCANMFINAKRCDAMKKLTRQRSSSGASSLNVSLNVSRNAKDLEEEHFKDCNDDFLLSQSLDSVPNQDMNSSRSDVFEESSMPQRFRSVSYNTPVSKVSAASPFKTPQISTPLRNLKPNKSILKTDLNSSRRDSFSAPLTPQHLKSVSNDDSFPDESPSVFKKTPKISTPLRTFKPKKPFEFGTPDLLQHKQGRKFSISSSVPLEGDENTNTNSPYSGFEFYGTPEKAFSPLDSSNVEKSEVFPVKPPVFSITPKKNISEQNPEVKAAKVYERSSTPYKGSFSFDRYDPCPSPGPKTNGNSGGVPDEERLLPSESFKTDTKNPDPDHRTSQRKRMLSPDGESAAAAKRVKRQEISPDDPGDADDGSVNEVKRHTTSIKAAAAPKTSSINKSENFVRLNMKVKRFSKHKGQRVKGAIYKRQQWKKRDKERTKDKSIEYGDKCFKCGQSGHWASKCTNGPSGYGGGKKGYGGRKKDEAEDEEPEPVDEEEYPTVAESAALARGVTLPKKTKGDPSNPDADADADADAEVEIERTIVRNPMEAFEIRSKRVSIEPFYSLNSDGSLPETTDEMYEALSKFGFTEFREGQKEAMMRTLCGLPTLVILSTGCGKSLCYQLPAYMYGQRSKSITIVVSPLVSLMEDQVQGLPPGIHGACLHTNMSQSQREAVLAAVNGGLVHFLLLSPEAVVGTQKSVLSGLNADVKIAFACIDEAHCLSQWSHNFRPSYLQVCRVLKNKFGVNCFLGLTATATLSQSSHIAEQIWIQDYDQAVIRGAPVPKNLMLTVSRDTHRDESLIELLQGERFANSESIIIYCTRRDQTERIGTLIRTTLKDKFLEKFKEPEEPEEDSEPGTKKKKKRKKKVTKPKLVCESYHAGLTPYQRKRIQNAFMSGQLWIVVATVAFGMGLDKSNVRCVIHYNMPKSFESYVQEIGRAGRDRITSHCHLFLDAQGTDLGELKKHVYSNTISRFTVKKFVQRVLKPCRCLEIHKRCSEKEKENLDEESEGESPNTFLDFKRGSRICQGHERAIPIDPLVNELDVKKENIATLFCYLELAYDGLMKPLPLTYGTCKVQCYGGPKQLQAVARRCPPMGVAIARQKLAGQKFSTIAAIDFPVIEVSDSMGWNSGLVKRELKGLQWNIESALGTKKSGVMVELTDLSFHFIVPGDLSDEELDNVVDNLYKRVTTQENLELNQIHRIHKAAKSVSYNSIVACSDKTDEKRNNKLHELILEYFDKTPCQELDPELDGGHLEHVELNKDQVHGSVRRFLSIYSCDHNFTGHTIARIFHGIDSPNFPAKVWGRVRQFWRLYIGSDFKTIVNIAAEEIINHRR